MSNCSYLCATEAPLTYPSTQKGYEPSEQLIASCAGNVPLLWPCLFRAEDIVRRSVPVDDAAVEIEIGQGVRGLLSRLRRPRRSSVVIDAPIVARATAIARLGASVGYLNALFEAEGRLDDHVALFQRALESVPHAHVTIELQEIEALVGAESFWENLRAILAGMGSDRSPTAKARLVRLSGLRPDRPFPPADMWLSGGAAAEDDQWNHHHIFGEGASGASFGRQVPWQPAQTPTRYLANAPHLVPVFIPRLEVLLARAESEKGSPLTEREVIEIRDHAYCAMVSPDSPLAQPPLAVDDIDPARCWEAWQARRKTSR